MLVMYYLEIFYQFSNIVYSTANRCYLMTSSNVDTREFDIDEDHLDQGKLMSVTESTCGSLVRLTW